LPGALQIADLYVSMADLELISWHPVLYYWPQYFDSRWAGLMSRLYDSGAAPILKRSRQALRELLTFRRHYSYMPMVYNSFVRRPLVERVRSRFGRYVLGSLP